LRRALLTVLCLSAMMACEKSRVENLQGRLDKFRNILPPELRQKFDSGDYQTVALGIDSLVQNDPQFKDEFERIKHDELIDVFSYREVVDFFGEHFAEKIEKIKQTKQDNR
jgi:hypothetical protein